VMRFRASNLVLLAVIVAAIAAAVLLTDRSHRQAADHSAQQSRANSELQDSMHHLVEVTEAYVSSEDGRILARYQPAITRVERAIADLEDLTGAEADEEAVLAAQVKAIRAQEKLDARAVGRTLAGDKASLAAQTARIATFDRVLAANARLDDVIDEERRSQQTRTGIASLIGVGLLGAVILSLGLAARREDRHRRRSRRFGEGLQSARTESEAFGLVRDHLEEEVPGSRVYVFSRNNSANRLEASTPVPEGSRLEKKLNDARPDDCLAVRTAQPKTGGERSKDVVRCQICGELGGGSLCVPSIVSGEVIGSVLVRNQRLLRDFAEHQVRIGVSEAAPVIAHLRSLALAERRAASDTLTGLPNKQAAEDTLRQLVAQAGRTRAPLAAIVFDLDHFKRVNDTLGHPKGDEVLAAVGSVTKGTVRESDFAARWGGEEFLVLLPGSDREGAAMVAEKLRISIAGVRVPEVEGVRASFGVAAMPDDAEGPEELLRRADRAMYAAKRAGRNRVETAAEETLEDEAAVEPAADARKPHLRAAD
jgi:diguanylate cyclase (GGDEF)-like protein